MNEAEKLTRALGGRWYGAYGTAACPICQPERRKDQNALTIRKPNDLLLLDCKRSKCSYSDLKRVSPIAEILGSRPQIVSRTASRTPATRTDTKNSQIAQSIWNAACPLQGTCAEAYLQSRGIGHFGSEALRFHPALWHGPTGKTLPALVARIDAGACFAIQRTFLPTDGQSVEPRKMMLGPAEGGHVPLVSGSGPLVVAEGIETSLSLACGLLQTEATIWAALSAPNMRRFSLPERPGHLVVATDGDKAGRSAGDFLAHRARALGWSVSLMPAPDGQDWNDVLMSRTKT